MTKRIIINESEMRVSKPGVDVTASPQPWQLLFSSKFTSPALIMKGAVTIAGNNQSQERTATVNYGQTLSKLPFVIAIARATSWNRSWTNGSEFSYLNGNWNSFFIEHPYFGPTNVYTGSNLERGTSNLDSTFASGKFIADVYSNRVVFRAGCPSNLRVRYAILRM